MGTNSPLQKFFASEVAHKVCQKSTHPYSMKMHMASSITRYPMKNRWFLAPANSDMYRCAHVHAFVKTYSTVLKIPYFPET
jgi:hypothetical protein